MPPAQRARFKLLALACATLPGFATRASPPAQPPIEVSAEAVERVGHEAEQAQLLVQTKRRLQRARRDLPKAKGAEAQLKNQQTIQELEQRIRRIEAQQRTQLTARQLRELPIGPLKAYIARVRQRIEVHGDRHAPEENGQSLYGATDIAFTVRADGTLAHLQVLWSVPIRLGLQTAVLLQELEPFERFPSGIAAQVDRISFVRSFRFEPGGGEPRYRLRSRPAGQGGAQGG